jgi:hypothetical protein
MRALDAAVAWATGYEIYVTSSGPRTELEVRRIERGGASGTGGPNVAAEERR